MTMATNLPDTLVRVDAADKVRGRPLYAADDARPGMMHAALAVATVAKGTVRTIDTDTAASRPGVRLVLTHRELSGMPPAGYLLTGKFASPGIQVMTSPRIAYRGQPIALVVADTLEAAIEAAATIRATYDAELVRISIADAPASDIVDQQGSPLPQQMFADKVAGDADPAVAAAPVTIDQRYTSPPQHPNPMELIATVAEWRGDTLVIKEGTQNSGAYRSGLASQLGLAPEQVEVISPQVGGGFGQKNAQQMHTVLVAIAARRLGRPVKLVVPRGQLFHDASFRPASRHRVRLGADRSGRFLAAIHETDQQTSRHDLFASQFADTTAPAVRSNAAGGRRAGAGRDQRDIRADNAGGLAFYDRMGFVDHDVTRAVPLRDGTLVDRVSKSHRLERLPA